MEVQCFVVVDEDRDGEMETRRWWGGPTMSTGQSQLVHFAISAIGYNCDFFSSVQLITKSQFFWTCCFR